MLAGTSAARTHLLGGHCRSGALLIRYSSQQLRAVWGAQARGQGAADSAEALARLVPGSTAEVAQELYSFLSHLNISGLGLVAATERSPLVSLLVSACRCPAADPAHVTLKLVSA